MSKWHGGKGSEYRAVDKNKFDENFDRIFGKKSCQACNTNSAEKSHSCPFKVELYKDYAMCNCCDECSYQCLMDI